MRILMLFAAVMQFLNFMPPQQKPAITFAQNMAQLTFPKTAAFSATISSGETITDVELLYGSEKRTCSDVQALVVPEFTPGKSVRVSWKWEMEDSGSIAPGSEVWWQWKATNEKGEKVTSEKKTIIWLYKIHPWKVKEDKNIRIHYYQITDQLADEFLKTALDAQEKLKTDTGMETTATVDLYMYKTAKEMRDSMLYEQEWTGGMAFTDSNKIVIGVVDTDIEWTKFTEAHELTHVLVGNYTFTCLWTTPTWLEEGLAVYAEGDPDDNTVEVFENAKKNDELISFHILSASFSSDSKLADLSYSQSFYMVKYLIETYGREKINNLLKTLSKGTTVDEALSTVYGFNLNGFEKEWRKSINVPEAQWAADAEKPTPVPTEIPTMRPVTNSVSTGPAAEPAADATPLPTGTAEASLPIAFGGTRNTPGSSNGPSGQSSDMTPPILAILGSLMVCVAVSAFAHFKNRRMGVVLTITLITIASVILGVTPARASSLPAAPTKYPQLPTATPYTPPPLEKGMYSNASSGISLKIPSNARIDTSRASSNYFFAMNLGSNAVLGHLFSYPLRAGKTLQQMAEDIRDNEMQGLVDMTHLESKEVELDDGAKGWLTVSEGQNPSEKITLRLSFMTVRGYSSAITLMLFAPPDNYTRFQENIDALNKSMKVSAPAVNGYSRNEILIIDGSETDNPAENDPATSHGSADFTYVFSGLVSYDTKLNIKPDLAQSWDISSDGLVYTFHLQPAAVFHNLRPVTANDVVYSWERAASPKTDSDTVLTYLGDIQGIKEMHEGTAEHISGLKVIDDHTLEVTLEEPVPYFLLKLTYPTGYIVDKENVEKSKTWYRVPNGTGPFRLIRWDARKAIHFERFEQFYGEKPRLKAMLILLYQGTSMQLYEQGNIDYTYIGYDDLVRFKDPAEPMHNQLQSNTNMCTGYVTFDVSQPPFDDVKVRQAFSMAVDKEKYVNVIMENGALPAKGLYPPALPGYNKNTPGLEFNPEKARALIKESKYGDGEMPPIIFSLSGYGSSVSEGVSALAQMWKENLGISITVQNIDPEYYQEVLDSGKHGQLISEGWCADYPDPENFADVLFHTGNAMNQGNYSNPDLDTILEEARVEKDPVKRIEMYQQAEKIIINDSPVIFLTHSNSYVLVKPYLQGFVGTPIDVPLERYLWIDAEKLRE